MVTSLNLKWFYSLSFIFLAILIAGIVNEFYWILLLPVVLLIVWMAFYRLDTLMLLTVFFTPFSINLQKTGLGIGVSLPVEPLIFLMMIIFILKIISEGNFDRKIITHPVSIIILLHLVWMCIATAFSSIPLVSVKATLARICFVAVYYFLATQLFRNFKNIKKFIWLYAISLIAVIIYTLFNHAAHLWTEKASHIMMNPFYNDHTAYAAAISLFIPVILAFTADNKNTAGKRIFSLLIIVLFFTATVLSYTRAAWVGLTAALICSFGFFFRIKTWIVISLAAGILIYVIASWTEIIIKLESNTEKSSTDYREHLESISNISTDASNVERVNRWLCALRMFNERPVFGWGPGTYQFQYAPFQRNDEKTYISTNAGDRGSSHSEYLGPLCEEGFLGALLMMAIAIAVIFKNSQYIIHTQNRGGKIIAIGIVLGLTTYWVHGFLNYFLDTDKASVPFWGFIAILTALQAYHNQKTTGVSGIKPTSE
ncbi:MAG: O-antigen ligase family protein [Bacteroidia bacterium]